MGLFDISNFYGIIYIYFQKGELLVENFLGLLIVFIIILFEPIMVYIIKKDKATIKGNSGEKYVAKELSRLNQKEYIVLNDLLLVDEEGYTTQIDHVVVSIFGIFVVETKNYKGLIYGSDKQKNWTQNIYGNKSYFYNPIRQNYRHVKVIEYTLGCSNKIIKPVIVFSDDATLTVNSRNIVVNICELYDAIYYTDIQIMSEEEMIEYAQLLKQKNINTSQNMKNHINALKRGEIGYYYRN